MSSNSDGAFLFYAEDGHYDFTYQKDGGSIDPTLNVAMYELPLGENVISVSRFQTTDLTASTVGAFDQIGSNVRTLIISRPVFALNNDECPTNITLVFVGTGSLDVANGKTLVRSCRAVNLTDHDVFIGSGTYDHTNGSVRKSVWMGASQLSVDGVQCANPAQVTLNSGPRVHTIICADNDASTIYGTMRLPANYDGGSITMIATYVQTAADTNALHADVSMQCRSNTGTINSSWGSEVPMDISSVAGSNAVNEVHSGQVTPNGACGGGDMLWWRWQVDASGTTTAMATLHVLGFTMRYGAFPNSPFVE
jgi:hypothetical protein